jgi:hypothetical protein
MQFTHEFMGRLVGAEGPVKGAPAGYVLLEREVRGQATVEARVGQPLYIRSDLV